MIRTAQFSVAIFPIGNARKEVALAKRAEEMGYDGIWVGDSHVIWRELYVMLGAIASTTHRVKISPGMTHSQVRHLTLTASALISLAELVGERLRIGFGVGASGPGNLGLKPVTTKALGESVATLRDLMNGKPAKIEDREFQIRFGAAERNIPFFLATSGVSTVRLAGRIAEGMILGANRQDMDTRIAIMREEARKAGRNTSDLQVALWLPCSISEDRVFARNQVKAHVARSAMSSIARKIAKGEQVSEEDRLATERLQKEYSFYHHMDSELGNLVPEHWVDHYALAGEPNEVRRRVEELVAIDGVTELAFVPWGPDREQVLRTLVREVLPNSQNRITT
ncbi:MAG: LLM class flavin-dependent oxidoreductase [Nitrososphaerales archaeon]